MKSIEEIQNLLLIEFTQYLPQVNVNNNKTEYYNNKLGDTSFLLAGLLEGLLKKEYQNWDHNKWLDDSLLTRINLEKAKLQIWGIIIEGRINNTAQWTEPFYYEAILYNNYSNFVEYFFLFGDIEKYEISYEKFCKNRDFWDKQYYSNNEWNPKEKKWKYVIKSNCT